MKARITAVVLTVLMVFMPVFLVIGSPAYVSAAEGTFSGTITDKTTPSILFLSTSGGVMQIKIDATTDTTGAKFLLPGNSVTCACYTGSDEYWHASKITGSSSAGRAEIDTSKQSTVTGTVGKGTSETMLYLETTAGKMEIKVDTSTDVSGLSALIIGKTVSVVCSRGADAYMHALSISNAQAGSVLADATTGLAPSGLSTAGQTSEQTATAITTPTSSISGTVDKQTTASKLYLITSGGTMQIKIDSTTDTSAAHVLMPKDSVTVAFYRGSDEYHHAASITKTSAKQSSQVNLDGGELSISGTISSKTSESTLFLDTSGGTMEIKLDGATDFSGAKVLIAGKTLNVTCKRGSDEYYHAVSVSY